jgi:hypothetical protein
VGALWLRGTHSFLSEAGLLCLGGAFPERLVWLIFL